MALVCKIVYHFYGCTANRYVDPDKYGYLDMVHDVYNSVLRHISDGKTVTFQVKFILPDRIQEMEVMSDTDVVKMFVVGEQLDSINLYVYNVHASEQMTHPYTINGFLNSVVGRDEASNLQVRKDDFLSDVESLETFITDFQGGANTSTRRPPKATGRRGGVTGIDFNHLGTSTKNYGSVGVVKLSSLSTTTTVESSGKRDGLDGLGSKSATKDDELFHLSDSDDEDWKSEVGEFNNCEDSSSGESKTSSEGDSDHNKPTGEQMDVESNDDLSDCKSDEEERINRVKQEGEKINLDVGQVFVDVNAFRAALADFSIQEGFEFLRLKNEKRGVTVICKSNGCTWRCHASPIDDMGTYMIKKYTPKHTCVRISSNNNATSRWIAKQLRARLRVDPYMRIETMQELLKESWQVEASKSQCYRARLHAREMNEKARVSQKFRKRNKNDRCDSKDIGHKKRGCRRAQ